MLVSAFGWYGALIGGGMVACIVMGYFMAKKRGYDTDNIFNIAIICIPIAIFGARTYFVVNDIIHNGTTWTIGEYFGFRGGHFEGFAGLAIYGGLLGGILGAIIVRLINKRKPPEKQMTFLQMADLCFCLIILGQAIGRWGNFANQEAYGQLVTDPAWQWFPFAVWIEKERNWFNACFFYESMWNLIGFGLLQWFYNGKRKSFDGFYFAFYCVWYGFIRFWVEGLRSDSMWFGPIKANQLISAIIFVFGAAMIIYHVVMAKRAGKKPFLFVKEELIGPDYYGYEKTFFHTKAVVAARAATAHDNSGDNASSDVETEVSDTSDPSDNAGSDEERQ